MRLTLRHTIGLALALASLWVATPSFAQLDILSGKPLAGDIGGLGGLVEEAYSISAEVLPASGKNPALLAITAKIEPDFHIFSITQKPGGPTRTKIVVNQSPDYRLTGDLRPTVAPNSHVDDIFKIPVETHESEVTWQVPIELNPNVDPAKIKIRGAVEAQACNDKTNSCLPPAKVSFETGVAPQPKVATTPPAAQGSAKSGGSAEGKYENPELHTRVAARVTPTSVAPGDTVKVEITAEPAKDWHLYALAPRPALTGARPGLIGLDANPVLRPQRVEISAAPTVYTNTDGSTNHVHEQAVTWTVEVQIPKDAPRGEQKISGVVGFQSCGNKTCDMPSAVRFETTIGVGVDAPKPNLTLTQASYSEAGKLSALLANIPRVTATALNGGAAAPATTESLLFIILSSLLGGMILNLMPCVLPVIGLKILSFVEQAGRARSHVLMLNLFYSAGLISVFLVLATLAVWLNLGWGEQFQSTAFNVVMSAIVFAMALSFLGVWEIPLPAFLGSGKATELAAREGAGGAFAKGVFTTILATPCSGPFLGPVFGFTLGQPPHIIYLIFFSIGLGMATPYLLIGAFPRLIRFLPKPGMWMDTFKQMMGFFLLGTIVYLFTFLNKDYLVPTFALLVGIWAALWWVGRTPLYEPVGKILAAWLSGAAVAAVVGWFAFTVLVPGKSLLDWKPFSPPVLAQATAEGKTVMVDFTADWCPTCKWNLAHSINTNEIREAVDSGQVETLLADWTSRSDEIKQTLASLGSRSIPVLAIFPAGKPNEPIILRDLISKDDILTALKKAGPSQPKSTASTAMVGASR